MKAKLYKALIGLIIIAFIAMGTLWLYQYLTGQIFDYLYGQIYPEYVISYKAPRLGELPPEKVIRKLAKMYKVDEALAVRIAKCENGTHEPDRKNYAWPVSTASGAFMFTNGTYIATRAQMGEPDPNLELKHDFAENTRTAMWKIANGGLSAWSASEDCWST